jgi:hypothetical protein
LPQPNHYPTKTCEARPWTSAGGFAISASAKYEAAFRDNAIDEQVLRDLTAEDLKEIGATDGDRRKLLAAIAELAAPSPSAEPLSRPSAAERRPLTS